MVQHNQQNVGGQAGQQQLPQQTSINLEDLQMNELQAQLLTAQRALSIALNSTSSLAVPQSSNMDDTATDTSDAMVGKTTSANVDCTERRTPFSYVNCNANNSGSYTSQSSLEQVQPSNSLVSQNGGPIAVHSKIYDLPEFSAAPEDWPMFSTAVFNYSNFQNCVRLHKALKGDAR